MPSTSRLSVLLSLALACSPEQVTPAPAEPPPELVVGREGAGPPPASWAEERSAAAMQRLGATDGGRIVLSAIEAAGGLRPWLAAGNIAFSFDYRPLTQPERRMHTFQRIDHWSARAVHEELEGGAGEVARFGWDGESAWITPNAEAFPAPARFWSLTPYYFVGMPFVLADPGARFEVLEDAELDGQRHHLVKITFVEGTGDAPDDYYILYVNAETNHMAALRYIVSYPGFFQPGQHSPEKLMRYTEFEEVGGLRFATRYDTYTWDPESASPGNKVTEIEAGRFALGEAMDERIFTAPDGATASALAPSGE